MSDLPRTCPRCLFIFLSLTALLVLSGQTGQAQDLTTRTPDRFDAGQRTFDDGRYNEAARHFEALLARDPAFYVPTRGAAAYWLGRVHLARGDSAVAHTVWRRGIEALGAEGIFDVRLADAYLRSVFHLARTDEQATAANAYLQLIARTGHPDLAVSERRIVRRHVAQMVFLLPGAMQARITPDAEALMHEGAALRPEASDHLAAWWHRQDPLPASLGNERIVEHLERVAHAEQHFADERFVRFDARGVVYVRLGAPARTATLDNEAIEMDGLGAFSSGTLAHPTVPPHAVWTYDDLGDAAVYLFVRRQHRYVLGTVRDLLPAELRGPKNVSLTLQVLRDYYKQLYRLHPGYLSLLNRIETYLLRASDRALTERMNGYSTQAPTPSPPGTEPSDPLSFAAHSVRDVRRFDKRLARRRAEAVPTAHTETIDEGDRLPVAARTARFLNDDGTTRTEVYWAVDPANLVPSPDARLRLLQQGLDVPDAYRLDVTAVRYGPGYRPQAKHRTQHTLPVDTEAPAVYSLALPGDTGRYHLALQWDQYATPAEENASPVYIRTGRQWVDSLQALPAASDTLVLSDPVPLRAADLDTAEPVRDDRGFRVTPYPFDAVAPDTALALYVEAYGLTFGADDRTRYTVEYTVARRRGRGGVRGFLLGGEEAETTAAATSHTGTSRTAHEYILLDFSPWDAADAFTVIVRVTDEVSGHHAARSVTFTLRP